MKIMKNHLFILLVLCFSSQLKAQYIQVDDTYTAQRLVQDVLIDSDCASVANFSVTGGDFGGRENSYGYFNAGTSSFPFAEGIILSTGRAKIAQGPNTSLSDDGRGMNWPGDQDLEQALRIGRSTDATILEFDFTPLSNKISFDYMLSSEEYHDTAPCNYADGFAFLLKQVGSTSAYQNLALVPGKTIAVNTMNIRPYINDDCRAQNEEYFGGFNGNEHPTNFNGQTKVMKAQADVIPGATYHIKLVIADEGNYRYDSAIFLGGGSFKIETDLGSSKLLSDGTALCQGEALTLTATNPTAISYKWFKNGIPQTGANTDQFAISVNENATYSVEVGLGGTCISHGEIKIEYAPAIVLSNATLVQCDENNDGLAFFNLTQAEAQITAGNTGLFSPIYFKTRTDALNDSNPITNETAFENTINPVFARAENQFGCFGISEVTLAVSNNNIVDPLPLNECDKYTNRLDGFTPFDLTENETAILINLPGGNIKYYTSHDDALAGTNAIPDPTNFVNTVAFEQMIYAKLSSGIDCFGIAKFKIIVNSFGTSLNDQDAIVCEGSDVPLNAGSGFSTYTWNTTPPKFTQIIRVRDAGTYTVTVTNSYGCEGTKTFHVKASNKAEIASVSVNDFNGGNNSVTINITPESIGDYEYSIDGVYFQQSPTFSNVRSGEYTAYVIDRNLCGSAKPYPFFVMDYPKFFTPNGDGYNEIWRVPYLSSQPNATVSIFDRYGKLVYFFKGNQQGWNGMHDGKTLPATDYWFKITLQSGREIRGHFSLLR